MQHNRPHILIESNIPFIRGVFDDIAYVSYLAPDEITPQSMRDTDALITRTRTRCDSRLLSGSRCSMIASATIGLDHIDLDYCRDNGIEVTNAPGCNAPAVAQYVFAAILSAWSVERLPSLTIGIVGVGHVGRIVENWARNFGMNVLLNDPPRAISEKTDAFISLDDIASRADIITIHTPYTTVGQYPTHRLFDDIRLRSLRRAPMLINAARGPIVDNDALCDAIDNGIVSHAVIDCWENEPAISRQLLEKAFIATPHIAGYSREGKLWASRMAAEAVARHFGLTLPVPAENVPMTPPAAVDAENITASYNPMADTEVLRSDPDAFERLRNHYYLRSEVTARS